jgi:hypothetical protein
MHIATASWQGQRKAWVRGGSSKTAIFPPIRGGANDSDSNSGAKKMDDSFSQQGAFPVADNIFKMWRSSNPVVTMLLEKIDQSNTVDDLFQIIEEIPAIKRSMERAMKISVADIDDAALAIHALARVAQLIGNISEDVDPLMLSEINHVIQDRRIEQLTECVELQLSALKIEELSKYLWSLVMIDLDDNEDFLKPVILEYNERLRIHYAIESNDIKESSSVMRMSKDQQAMMIWALGCVRDRYPSSGNHEGLLDKLLESLLSCPDQFQYKDSSAIIQMLNPQLVVRMLWSLSIHSSPSNQGLYKTVMTLGLEATVKRIESLSLTNKIMLLWCSAQYGIVAKMSTSRLLSNLAIHLQRGELDREDQIYVVDSIRLISGITRRLYIKLKDEETAAKLKEDEDDGEEPLKNSRKWKHRHCQGTTKAENMNSVECLAILESSGAMIYHIAQLTTRDMDVLPMTFLTSVFKAIATVELHGLNDRQVMVDFVQKLMLRVNAELEGRGIRGFITPKEAANLLEAMVLNTDYHSLLSMENAKVISMGSQPALTAWEVVSPDPAWHKIAGKLAVISSVNAAEIGEKSQVVAASWAIACLGHSYRPLFRVARRATQFVLHEQTAQTLARLAVTIASEEAASFASGGGMSVKLDHEFVDQVAISTLRRAKEIPSLKELVHAVVSIAFLGRLSSSGTKLQWNLHPSNNNNEDRSDDPPDAPLPENDKIVDISALSLSYLTTKQLIRLQWAIGRLPVGIFSPSTVERLRMELDQRPLAPSDSDTLATKDKMSIKDAFLYVKTLVDSAAIKENALTHLKDKVCSTLMQHCATLFRSVQVAVPPAMDDKPAINESNYDKDKFYLHDKEFYMIANPSILIDTIQAFIELNWYNTEMVRICTNFVENFHLDKTSGLTPTTKRAVSFQQGILDELLKVYKNLPMNNKRMNKKHLKSPLKKRMTGLLSKVLGGAHARST